MNNQSVEPEIYAGQAFHKAFPKGRSSGELHLNSSHLTFKCEHDFVTFSLVDVNIKMGGANDRLVFFSHKSHPEWSVYTADRRVLRSSYLSNNKELKSQVNKAKRVRMWGWSTLGAMAMLIVMIPTMLIFSMDTITGWIAPSIPAEIEVSIGESSWAQYKLNNKVLGSNEVTEPLKRMIQPLLDAAANERFEFTIHVVESSELNAFALPGGIIALNSGLILAADNRDEVLGVLAHEISHVTGQHSIRSIIGTAGIIITVQAFFGDFSGLLGLVVDAGPLLLSQSYSRSFESEADANGFALLVNSGIDPSGMSQFFRRIIKEQQEVMANIEDEDTRSLIELTSGFLSSHPDTEERVVLIEEKISELQQHFETTNVDFKQLQAAVKIIVAKEVDKIDKVEK